MIAVCLGRWPRRRLLSRKEHGRWLLAAHPEPLACTHPPYTLELTGLACCSKPCHLRGEQRAFAAVGVARFMLYEFAHQGCGRSGVPAMGYSNPPASRQLTRPPCRRYILHRLVLGPARAVFRSNAILCARPGLAIASLRRSGSVREWLLVGCGQSAGSRQKRLKCGRVSRFPRHVPALGRIDRSMRALACEAALHKAHGVREQ